MYIKTLTEQENKSERLWTQMAANMGDSMKALVDSKHGAKAHLG